MSDEVARKKYDRALQLIEQAQVLLSEAAGELCPLIGAVKQWDLVGKHYRQTKELWRKVAYSYTREKVRLDSSEFSPPTEPKP